jgi:hypothetical protein
MCGSDLGICEGWVSWRAWGIGGGTQHEMDVSEDGYGRWAGWEVRGAMADAEDAVEGGDDEGGDDSSVEGRHCWVWLRFFPSLFWLSANENRGRSSGTLWGPQRSDIPIHSNLLRVESSDPDAQPRCTVMQVICSLLHVPTGNNFGKYDLLLCRA